MKKLKSINLSYAGPAIFILLWYFVSKLGLVDSFFFPGPVSTLKEVWNLFYNRILVEDLLATSYRVLAAFFIAVMVGVPLGLFLGLFERLYRSVEFIIDFSRSMTVISMFPLFMILFGVGDTSKIAVAAFSGTIVIVFNTSYNIIHTNKSRRLAAKIMGANNIQIFTKIIFWESLPSLFSGLRIGLGWIIAGVISTEMFVGTKYGLGHKVMDYQYTYNILGVYGCLFTIGVFGYLLNFIFVTIEKKLLHWSSR